jgi:hypothetical protein
MVSEEENVMLVAPFSEEEVRDAVFSCYAEGAPGPDGITFLFYQKFWEVIKHDILSMFKDFHEGELDLYRLNFAMLTLIPKVSEARNMRNFRPISLANCSFKIFSKVMAIILGKIADRLIMKNQSAFIKGRYILESVETAHEIVHSVSGNNERGIVLKLDYEKAYDRVDIDFLLEILQARNFNRTWIGWIRKIITGGSVGVNLNGEESAFFKTCKGLKQGDPISHMLFNLVGDVLTRMLLKAAEQGLVKWI